MNKMMALGLLISGSAVINASESLVARILKEAEGVTVEENEEGKTTELVKLFGKAVEDAASKNIGSLILHNHPIIPLILRSIDLISVPLEQKAFATYEPDPDEKAWFRSLISHALMKTKNDGAESIQVHSATNKILKINNDGSAVVGDVKTRELVATLRGHADTILSASFNKDGTRIITGSADGTAKIWNAQTGECLQTFQGHEEEVNSAEFSFSEEKVITADDDGVAKIWNARTGECLVTLDGDGSFISSAQLNARGDLAVTACPGYIKIWDVATGFCLNKIELDDDGYSYPCFTCSGNKIIIPQKDSSMKIWDIGPLIKLRNFLGREDTVTLSQAVLLDAIYETVICKRLVHEKKDEAFTSLDKAVQEDQIRFDFKKYPELEKHFSALDVDGFYNALRGGHPLTSHSVDLRQLLEPYVKHIPIEAASSSATSSTAVSVDMHKNKRQKTEDEK